MRILIFSLIFLLASCSLFRDPELKPSRMDEAKKRRIENQATDVYIENSLQKDSSTTDSQEAGLLNRSQIQSEYGIELSWDIPDDPVDAFIIYSGNTENNLDSELELNINELKTTAEGKYLYVIRPVDPTKTVFVAIAAKRGSTISEKSLPQEFAPNPKFSAQ